MQKPKYEYGLELEIAPTYGICVEEGTVEIGGFLHPSLLGNWKGSDENPNLVLDIWLSGDPELDSDIQTKPWYILKYIHFNLNDLEEEDNCIILPEFALEEVVHRANLNKIEKWSILG